MLSTCDFFLLNNTLVFPLIDFFCISKFITVPIISNANSVEGPEVSVEISKNDKEYEEREGETSAIRSDANISVDDLKDSLDNTKVVDLSNSNKLIKYFVSPSYIKKMKTFSPNEIDNSKSKYFPPIMNQGILNSCTTWSTVYYQMSYAVNKELDRDGSLPQNQFSPTWIYNMANEGENKGNFYADILKILSEIGAVPMTKVDAKTTDEGDNVRNVLANKELWLEASQYRVDEYYTINIDKEAIEPVFTDPDDKDLDAIKKALAMGEILTATTYSYKWKTSKIVENKKVSKNKKYVGEFIVTETTGKSKGAHRVTIVGYNDNIWIDINENGIVEKAEKGAFKIANSYGNMLHNEGFVWMSYDALNAVSAVKEADKDRSAGLFDVIGFSIDLDDKDDDCYAVLNVKTKDLKSLNVKITAVDEDGNEQVYEPAPFSNALIRGMGAYPFNNSENGEVGEFYMDLSNAVKDIKFNDMSKYEWNFEIVDTSEENEIIIGSLKIYDKLNDEYTETYIEEPISINKNTANILIERKKTNLLDLARIF